MFFLFTRKLYLNTVNEIFVQFHCLSSYRNDGFLKKRIRARAIGATRVTGVLSLGRGMHFNLVPRGFPTRPYGARESSLYLSIRSDG